ncbi:MAG: hypothetical protein KF884_03010 [Fimbriimonadaceae bacterium]|nr:hypothetical protein [Fimbriimonadaceae bacterium]QYK59066.1 MAG: hypothetical protein KF884_03010 [Fimbriimonadaceae bacterium]
MQYLDTGWFGVAFVALLVFFLLFNIIRADRGGKQLYIRRIPGLNAIDDAIGRATEMGRPVFMVPGIGDLNAISVQAINVFAHVSKLASQFGTPIRICIANAAVYTVAQEVIRDVYQKQGMIDRYDVDSVRFVSDRQFAFAAGVSGLLIREKAAATFLLGEFFAESLIFAETANSLGAIQVAGSTQTSQTPFFVAACDYVLLGDEFYAASAYLTRQPILVGSLVGQDWCKILVAGFVLVGALANSAERTQVATVTRAGYLDTISPEQIASEAEALGVTESIYRARVASAQVEVPVKEERASNPKLNKKARNETSFFRLFSPMISKESLTIVRPQKPTVEPEGEGE